MIVCDKTIVSVLDASVVQNTDRMSDRGTSPPPVVPVAAASSSAPITAQPESEMDALLLGRIGVSKQSFIHNVFISNLLSVTVQSETEMDKLA